MGNNTKDESRSKVENSSKIANSSKIEKSSKAKNRPNVYVCFGVVFLVISVYFYKPLKESQMFSVTNDIDTIHPDLEEDAKLTVPELVAKYGYTSEVHKVTTEDGYILHLHRISGGPTSPPKKGKQVVFLKHGLTTSSMSFVISGPHHALGYRLVDEGFDVWMGNARGNIYSNNHTYLESFGSAKDQARFWTFSWHEIGYYDLPASIDYVLEKTGQKKMQFIGHSQGATAFFVMAAERPEYNEKIETMHALGPAVFLSASFSPPFTAAAPYIRSIKKVLTLFGVYYLYPNSAAAKVCTDIEFVKRYCEESISWVMGASDQMNATLMPIIYKQIPGGFAINQFVHYAQVMNSGHFRKFDHGPTENLKRYNQPHPPHYNLSNIKAPIAFYYAKSDSVTVVEDISKLIKELPNVVKDYIVPYEKFNHVDFVLGVDAPELVYTEILKMMNSTSKGDQKIESP